MTRSSAPPPGQWQYGAHPAASGLKVRSLGRVELPLGDALRLEMTKADADGPDLVYLQYFIATDGGGWALWLSCHPGELAGNEAVLRELTAAEGDS